MVDGPNQLWVADITTIGAGFVYLAAILIAWSRRVGSAARSTHVWQLQH
jgi:hypothetical protein